MAKISNTNFATPVEAENAFYEAMRTGNLDALMDVFAEDEEIVCIHPNGQRMIGHRAIRNSWKSVFNGNRHLQVTISRYISWDSALMSIHNIIERIAIEGDNSELLLAATNVYVRGAKGWRMLIHHASAIHETEAATIESSDHPPRVLH